MTLLKTTRTRLGRGVERIRYPAAPRSRRLQKQPFPHRGRVVKGARCNKHNQLHTSTAAIIASPWPFAQTGFSDGSQGHRMPAAAI